MSSAVKHTQLISRPCKRQVQSSPAEGTKLWTHLHSAATHNSRPAAGSPWTPPPDPFTDPTAGTQGPHYLTPSFESSRPAAGTHRTPPPDPFTHQPHAQYTACCRHSPNPPTWPLHSNATRTVHSMLLVLTRPHHRTPSLTLLLALTGPHHRTPSLTLLLALTGPHHLTPPPDPFTHPAAGTHRTPPPDAFTHSAAGTHRTPSLTLLLALGDSSRTPQKPSRGQTASPRVDTGSYRYLPLTTGLLAGRSMTTWGQMSMCILYILWHVCSDRSLAPSPTRPPISQTS